MEAGEIHLVGSGKATLDFAEFGVPDYFQDIWVAYLYRPEKLLEGLLVEDVFLEGDGFHEYDPFGVVLFHDVKVSNIRMIAFLYELKVIGVNLARLKHGS